MAPKHITDAELITRILRAFEKRNTRRPNRVTKETQTERDLVLLDRIESVLSDAGRL